jgi:hypothetical protein
MKWCPDFCFLECTYVSIQFLLLEECNLVVLVLILMLALVGQLPAGAHGSKKMVLLAFIFSI